MSKEVALRVYDISRGLASSLSGPLFGQSLEGVWHTGIQCFDREFFYGGVIQDMLPSEFERSYGISPSKIISLGTTIKTLEEFRSFLDTNYHRFTESTYNILHWNCNHFSNECVKFLLNGMEAPREIIHQHEIIQQTPMGASIIEMLQNIAVSNPIGGGHEFEYRSTSLSSPPTTSTEAQQKQLNETPLGKEINKLIESATPQEAQTALDMLEKLAANIINNSTVVKYRVVKKSNTKLQQSLLNVSNGLQCLMALGFEEKELQVESTTSTEAGFEYPVVTAARLRELYSQRKLIQSILESKFYIQPSATTEPSAGTIANMSEIDSTLLAASPQYQQQLEQLMGMGFQDRDECLRALQASSGNINRALDKLTGI